MRCRCLGLPLPAQHTGTRSPTFTESGNSPLTASSTASSSSSGYFRLFQWRHTTHKPRATQTPIAPFWGVAVLCSNGGQTDGCIDEWFVCVLGYATTGSAREVTIGYSMNRVWVRLQTDSEVRIHPEHSPRGSVFVFASPTQAGRGRSGHIRFGIARHSALEKVSRSA